MADLTITAASFLPSDNASIVTCVAGATIAAGDVLYRDTADSSKVKPADANSGTSAARTVFGIALHAVAAGQKLLVVTEDPALVVGAAVVTGTTYILSANAGKIAPDSDAAAGWYKTILGVAISTTAINFRPLASGVAV
jgi:hypothetical protein